MILFPEEILKTQICSACKQYLSYGPIKVSFSEGVKCGRCLKNEEEATPSLLNNIIKNILFPCVNRFDGCNELLKVKNVPQHENVCKGSLHSCPICINDSNNQVVKFSLLSLIHHYRVLHSQYYITKPLLSISTNSAKESNYLFCNEYKNILAFINVKVIAGLPYVKIVALGNNKTKIVWSLNCHNIGDVIVTECASSAPTGESCFELSPANSDEGSYKMCLELEFSLSITTSSISSEESKEEIKPEDLKYSGEPYDDFMLKCMPDFRHSSNQIILNGQALEKIRKKSIFGKIYIFRDGNGEYDVMCDLCENYHFLTGPSYSSLNSNNEQITNCNICRASWCPNWCKNSQSSIREVLPRYRGRSRGIQTRGPLSVGILQSCYLCKNIPSHTVNQYLLQKLNYEIFYCRYQCGTAIKYDAVLDHEKTCSNNRKAALSDCEFAKFFFGNYFIDSSDDCKSTVIRENNRVVFEEQSFGPHGRIYMVTESGFCCIILYKSDTSYINFSVVHKYPLDKYYTLFKIVDRTNQSFRVEKNCFKVSLQTEKFFFVVAPREFPE